MSVLFIALVDFNKKDEHFFQQIM